MFFGVASPRLPSTLHAYAHTARELERSGLMMQMAYQEVSAALAIPQHLQVTEHVCIGTIGPLPGSQLLQDNGMTLQRTDIGIKSQHAQCQACIKQPYR